MKTSDQPYDFDEVRTALIKSGLLERNAILSLDAYPEAFSRRRRSRRWHYRVSNGQRDLCHLIVGSDLAAVRERAEAIAKACPKLICRPILFWENERGIGFLCLEHFSGESLDSMVENGRCTASDWLDRVRGAQSLLKLTEQVSTAADLQREVEALIDDACDFPGFSDFDTSILRQSVKHAILAGALAGPKLQRWSNGDFSGRNILIGSQGTMRLIDYEFACCTHFGADDWLRLSEFSTIPADLHRDMIPELKLAYQPWREVRFWVHHLVQLRNVEPSDELTYHISEVVGRLFQATGRVLPENRSRKPHSRLINLLCEKQQRTEQLLQNRTSWAMALEADLQKARDDFSVQTKLLDERSLWANSQEKDLRATQELIERLTKENTERLAWARSLETDLQKARDDFSVQTKLLDERSSWAKSLEADLEKARNDFGIQAKLVEDRTVWGKALEHELRSTQDNFVQLSEERDRLTAEIAALVPLRSRLEADLGCIKSACAALATAISADLEKGEVSVLEETLIALANLRRDLASQTAATNTAAAATLEAKLRADSGESEARLLTTALSDAQLHIDSLLQHISVLQERINTLEADKVEAEKTIQQAESRLTSCIAELQSSRLELARYQSRPLCRLVMRLASGKTITRSRP